MSFVTWLGWLAKTLASWAIAIVLMFLGAYMMAYGEALIGVVFLGLGIVALLFGFYNRDVVGEPGI